MTTRRVLCVAALATWGCKAPTPPPAQPAKKAPSAAAPATKAAAAKPAAPATQTAPPSVAADPRLAKAAAKCSKLVSAVVINGDALSAFPKVAPAFAAVQDGGLVWVCPGAHAVQATLTLKGKTGVTVAGRDALVLAVQDTLVVDVADSADVRFQGVAFGHATTQGECGSDVMRARQVKGLRLSQVGLHGSGIVGLALSQVSDAVIEDSLFVQCQTGLTAEGPKPQTRRNRFVANDRHLGSGLAAGPGDRLGPVRDKGATVAAEPPKPNPLAGHPAVPLDERLGTRWAVLNVEQFQELKAAACGRDAKTGECSRPVPFKGAAPDHPAAKAKAVTLVTAKGACTATLGPLQQVEHRDCEPTTLTVRAVQGCAGAAAPLALVGADAPVAKGLAWVPRVAPEKGAPTPPALKAWTQAQLADDVISEAIVKAAPGGHWADLRWTANAGKETLVTHALGVQIDLPECHLTDRHFSAAWLNDTPVRLPADALSWIPWAGVLARDGKIWGLVSRGANDTTLHVRAADGFLPVFSGAHAADHDECLAGYGPVAFETPCGP